MKENAKREVHDDAIFIAINKSLQACSSWIPFQADYFKALQNMALGLRKKMVNTLKDVKLIHFQNTVARCKNLAKQRQEEAARKNKKKKKKKNMKWREREVQTRAPQRKKEVPGNDACLKEGRG